MSRTPDERTPLLTPEQRRVAVTPQQTATRSHSQVGFFNSNLATAPIKVLPTDALSVVTTHLSPADVFQFAQTSSHNNAAAQPFFRAEKKRRREASKSAAYEKMQQLGISAAVVARLQELKGTDNEELISNPVFLVERLELYKRYLYPIPRDRFEISELTPLESLDALELSYLAGERTRIPLDLQTNPYAIKYLRMRCLSGKDDDFADLNPQLAVLRNTLVGGNFNNFVRLAHSADITYFRRASFAFLGAIAERFFQLGSFCMLPLLVVAILTIVSLPTLPTLLIILSAGTFGPIMLGMLINPVFGKAFVALFSLLFSDARNKTIFLNGDDSYLDCVILSGDTGLFKLVSKHRFAPFYSWNRIDRAIELLHYAALSGNAEIFRAIMAELPRFNFHIPLFYRPRRWFVEGTDEQGRNLANYAMAGGNAEIIAAVSALGIEPLPEAERALEELAAPPVWQGAAPGAAHQEMARALAAMDRRTPPAETETEAGEAQPNSPSFSP